jgi:signal peptidase I
MLRVGMDRVTSEDATSVTRDRPRRAWLAAVLSGLAPGAGHVYARRPLRGFVYVTLLGALCWVWTAPAGRSWVAARLLALPPCVLTLALIADSAVVARRPLPPSDLALALDRWWVYPIVFAMTAFLVPTLLAWRLDSVAGVVSLADAGMQPQLLPADRVVYDKTAFRAEAPKRGEVVVVEQGPLMPTVRRVVGLPGERIELWRGVVKVDGSEWPADRQSGRGSASAFVPAIIVGPEEVVVLPDSRDEADATRWRVPRSAVVGRASYVLLPLGYDAMRLGMAVR